MQFPPEKKLKLINDLVDENFFRVEVLIPLFRNMGKFEQVIDNHGPNEKGTDIVLVEKATFGGYRYTSIILKSVHITNATNTRKDREAAANVSQQIALAINSGHSCNLAKKHVDYNTILVITSQTISNTARESLIASGTAFRFTDIQFFQGDDLVSLIDEFLPKFYYYQSGYQARIAASIQSKCEQLSDLQNLPQFTVPERALLDVFVQPQLQHIASKRSGGKTVNQIVNSTPDKILAGNKRILIIGEPGSGKSIIMREAVLYLLTKNSRDNRPFLPLLVKAHDLSKSDSGIFEETIEKVVQQVYNLPDFDFKLVRKDSDVTLLIDGLDEIIDLNMREKLRGRISDFGDKNPEVRIVITSRRTQDITNINSMPSYQRWEILPFNFTQVREFFGKWFSNREENSTRLLAALENHELLSRLPNTPLVLTLLAILFNSDNTREVPANLAELYQMFFDLLLGKWNLDRRVETMHQAQIREYLAIEIAKKMHHEHLLSISRDVFSEIVQNAADQRGITIHLSELISDFTEQTALLVYNDKDELEFRHLSFQEFLVALAFHKHSSRDEVDFLVQNFDQSWWTKVLYFYCGLRQDTPEILNNLTARLPELNFQKQIVAILELGYLIQAAYLTPISVRIDTVESALRQFYKCLAACRRAKLDQFLGAQTFRFSRSLASQMAEYGKNAALNHRISGSRHGAARRNG